MSFLLAAGKCPVPSQCRLQSISSHGDPLAHSQVRLLSVPPLLPGCERLEAGTLCAYFSCVLVSRTVPGPPQPYTEEQMSLTQTARGQAVGSIRFCTSQHMI